MRQVFSTGQVSKITGVAPRTVSKWFDSGRLKGYRIPGSQDRRVPRDRLVEFLRANGMPVPPELEADALVHVVLLVGMGDPEAARLADLLPWSDGFRLLAAGNKFAAGVLYQGERPRSVVADLSIGRGEARDLALFVRDSEQGSERRTLLVAVRGEDDTPSADPWPWDAQIQRPFDPALLAELLRRGKEGGGG